MIPALNYNIHLQGQKVVDTLQKVGFKFEKRSTVNFDTPEIKKKQLKKMRMFDWFKILKRW